MALFIEADDGWINLDHIARVTQALGENRTALFYDADGKIVGRKNRCEGLDIHELTAPIVPAAAGAAAFVVSTISSEHGGRPDEVCCRPEQIVAWRLMYGGAVPLLIEATTSNEVVLIPLPDGRLLCPEHEIFEDVNGAKTALLRYAQSNWDRSRAAKAARREARPMVPA
jgi:hypothetical protein